MTRRHILFLISFLLSITAFSQYNLNDYKYVILPRKYEFLKHPDQFQLNSLTKFLLEKEKFTVYFNDNLPAEIANNSCLALRGNVLDQSNFLSTKLIFVLKDCYNNEVFRTQEGHSKLKDYKQGYHQSLREAFKSFDAIDYKYQPKSTEKSLVEIAPQAENKEKSAVKVQEAMDQSVDKMPKQPTKPKFQTVVERGTEKSRLLTDILGKGVLTAKSFELGYKVVDADNNEVMILLMTAKDDVFLVKDKNALVSKKNNSWIYSENDGVDFLVKMINIKFQ